MSELVKRLRDQGKDAFARQYSLGMFKMCADAADEIERLRTALEAINQAALNGLVCDDVAWMGPIETLHDFCERTLFPVGGVKEP